MPTLLSVTPVSTDQIDLVWGASTDDFLLGGYQVFRGLTQIATTTLTSYSDSGLTASTLYQYSVRAYDSTFNISSSSNTLATSTLAVVSTTTPSGGGGGSQTNGTSLSIIHIDINPQLHAALFSFETTAVAKFQLRWGRTTSYELGFVSNDLYKKSHTTEVTDLEAGTAYEYELVGYTKNGMTVVLKRGTFTTDEGPDNTPPSNVGNLRGKVVEGTVQLSWENPNDADFKDVRIVRNYLFYPATQTDGFLVYEGSGLSHNDSNPFLKTDVQYYTVFSRDGQGNVSSGAIIALSMGRPQAEWSAVHSESGAVHNTTQNNTQDNATLQLEDFEFFQKEMFVTDRRLLSSSAYLVRIAYEKVPPHLKTITFTLFDKVSGKESQSSYLLKINRDKTFYEAVVPAFGEERKVSVRFSVFDFKTKIQTSVVGEVYFYTVTGSEVVGERTFAQIPFLTTYAVDSKPLTFVVFSSFFSLLFLLMYFLRRIFR
jgi:hypothetical protein